MTIEKGNCMIHSGNIEWSWGRRAERERVWLARRRPLFQLGRSSCACWRGYTETQAAWCGLQGQVRKAKHLSWEPGNEVRKQGFSELLRKESQ